MHLCRARFFGLKLWAFPFACKPIETAGSRAGDLWPRDRIPAPDDPQHCPFCQEYLLAGAYLLPAPVVLPLPIVAAVESFLPVREVTWSVRFSHAWRGRGPPLH